MNSEAQPISINKQNEFLANIIMQNETSRNKIGDLVVGYLKSEKTFSKIFKEVVKVVNNFSKGGTHRNGCSEIIAVMILNSNFYMALEQLTEVEQEKLSNIILLS